MAGEAGSGPAAPGGGRLGGRATRGSAWVVAGYGAGQVIRFGANLVLTRLLFPQAFGLMLLLNVFLQGLQMFSDLGVGTAIIQSPRDDEAFVDTAWTVQVARGLVLWLVTVLLGWPLAAAYGEPQLLWLLPVAGASALLDGLASTALHTASRDLRLGRLQAVELASQLAAATVMIAAAWAARSVWALVAGLLVGTGTRTLLTHLALGGRRNRLRWEPEAARSLLGFGKWVFVSSVVTFLAQQGDRLVFGRMLPMARLGVYNIALSLCEAPSALVSAVSFRVFFPLFSELRRSGPSVDQAYARAASALGLAGGAGALALLLGGPLVTALLYDARYAEASTIIRLLALGIWGTTVVHFAAAFVLSGGHTKWLAAANAARLAWLAALVPLSFLRLGLEAAILAVVLADLPRYALLGLACRRDGLHVFAADARRTAAFAIAAGLGLGALAAFGEERPLPVAVAGLVSLGAWLALNAEATGWYVGKLRGALAARRAPAQA